jgi:hypothetical protein
MALHHSEWFSQTNKIKNKYKRWYLFLFLFDVIKIIY